MGAHKPYNGHKNWTHWNVSLWLFNGNECAYKMVCHAVRISPTLDIAARRILDHLEGQSTPDGARYTFTSIRAAIANWDS